MKFIRWGMEIIRRLFQWLYVIFSWNCYPQEKPTKDLEKEKKIYLNWINFLTITRKLLSVTKDPFLFPTNSIMRFQKMSISQHNKKFFSFHWWKDSFIRHPLKELTTPFVKCDAHILETFHQITQRREI